MTRRREQARGQPRVEVQFNHADRRYRPLDDLSVRYEVAGIAGETVRAIEQSILWYTEGKGEEDLGVHSFARITDAGLLPPASMTGSFGAQVPTSPLSYEGVIVKVRWCVRVRIFFEGGRDFVSEHVFDVGSIPPSRPPARPQPAGAET